MTDFRTIGVTAGGETTTFVAVSRSHFPDVTDSKIEGFTNERDVHTAQLVLTAADFAWLHTLL